MIKPMTSHGVLDISVTVPLDSDSTPSPWRTYGQKFFSECHDESGKMQCVHSTTCNIQSAIEMIDQMTTYMGRRLLRYR